MGLVRVDEALTIDGTMMSKERQLILGSKKKYERCHISYGTRMGQRKNLSP